MTVRARDLYVTAHIIELAARDLPHLETHIATQRAQTHGYPTNTGEPTVTTTNDTSTTERNALQLLALTHDWDTIQTDLTTLIQLANSVSNRTRRALATHTTTSTTPAIALCDGRTKDGFEHWGEACYRTADKAGLCSRHYMAARRWRANNDRPPLDTETR